MFLKIYKEDVIEGLQKAASIIPQRTGAAYLRSIWLKVEQGKLEILSTDSNIEFRGSYTAEVIEDGLVGVQGRAFVELLRRLPGGQISLKLDSDSSSLFIEQGRRKYKLPTNDATWFQNFSDFPEDGAVLWSGDYLQELIDRIVFCIADEGLDSINYLIMKPALEEKIEVAGMNGHQFAMMSFSHDSLRNLLPAEGILLQKKYIGEMKKWLGTDEIDLNIKDNRLFLRTTDKKESLSVPLSTYQYPDYLSFVRKINNSENSKMVLKRADAQDALQRIAIFNSESDRCTNFSLSSKEVILNVAGQDVGSATETLDVEYKGNIEKIAFPTSNLLGILDHFSSEELTFTFTGTEEPCGIQGSADPEYLVIIMPMKIIDEKMYSEEQV